MGYLAPFLANKTIISHKLIVFLLFFCFVLFFLFFSSEQDLTSGWETIKSSTELNQTVSTVELNNTELPLVPGEDGEQVIFAKY